MMGWFDGVLVEYSYCMRRSRSLFDLVVLYILLGWVDMYEVLYEYSKSRVRVRCEAGPPDLIQLSFFLISCSAALRYVNENQSGWALL